ncbi:hypothetical protein ColTof4_03538 [Colletotrichum tofieldiae]|nr:hypothetical protein ColTof3_13034 [Colletotrichum tofieldiae]GKT71115.1 hypothetical protein ColTof4_03538 [Colletotrichum tofieldiae]GKT93969.1 hypothetical protein Ct61P_11819 [Colletotrichum tofieldiae]
MNKAGSGLKPDIDGLWEELLSVWSKSSGSSGKLGIDIDEEDGKMNEGSPSDTSWLALSIFEDGINKLGVN